MKLQSLALILAFVSVPCAAQSYKFDFSGSKKPGKDFVRVSPSTVYNDSVGYGYDFLPAPENPDSPWFFSVKVPDGNYKVKVRLGSDKSAGLTTLRGESRRLMGEHIATKKGEDKEFTYIINKRDSVISPKVMVGVKNNERQKLNWDNRLTLEINGEHPRVRSIEIERDTIAPTIFLAGNSTVVDNDCEPYTSWGQMIPCFFDENVAIANYAESGLAADTFIGQRRLKKALTQMKPGDYLFVEFAHNDQKQKGPGKGSHYSFAYFMKQFIDEARAKGVTPVLVTPTRRRFFDEKGNIQDTHLDYPEVVREMSAREKTPLIDLQEMTKVICETLGPEDSKKLFVHYPPNTYKNQTVALKDNTHFSTYGAYEVAKCILEGMRYVGIPLVKYVRPQYKDGFSPALPDSFETYKWDLSPFEFPEKPDGN